MTYPKEKLDASDAAGWYECRDDEDHVVVRWWDGGVLLHRHSGELCKRWYTSFVPLAPAPEVVEGPAELTTGKWLILDPYGKVWSAWERVGGDTHERVESGFRAIRIDAWLAALKKSEPVVTERHREAAEAVRELLYAKAGTPDDIDAILARHFPAEAAK